MAKALLLEDAPPDGYMDGPPDGYEDTPSVAAKQPVVNVVTPVVRTPNQGAKQLSPAMTAYQRGLDSFLAGDRAGAETHSKEALRIDPNLTEASRMLDRLRFDSTAGIATQSQGNPSPVIEKTNLNMAAEVATGLVKAALPPMPRTFTEAGRALAAPLNAMPTPNISKEDVGQEAVRAAKGFASGVGGMVEGAGGATRWLTNEKAGKGLSEYGKKMQSFYSVPDPKFRDAVYSGVGSLATFLIPGMGVAKGTQAISFAPRLASWLGVGASSVMEALVESGANYERGLDKFKDTKEASNAATKTFWLNLPTLVFTNKVGLFGDKGPAVLKWLKSASGEAVQEWTQQVFGNMAVKDPAFQGAGTAGAVGLLTGGGVKAVETLSDVVSGQDVAPLDKISQPEYPVVNEPSGVAPSSSGGIVPGGGAGGPTVQGSSPDNPPDGFIDGPSVSVGQEIQPQRQQPELGTASTLSTSSENVALPPAPPVQDIGQSAQPQSETNPQSPVEPSAPSGKFPKKQTKKEKQLTPIEGLASVVPRRSTFPILTGFNVKNGVASATDLTTLLETKVDLPDGHYKMVGKNVEKSGLDQRDFPESPDVGNKIGTVDRADFVRNFDRVEKASSDDSTRYVLQSVNLRVEGGKSYLVATDGRRLSLSPLDSGNLADGSYIIPSNAGVGKALKALDGDKMDVSIINEKDGTPSQISFTSPNGRVVARMIDGKYPNIDQVIPEPTEQIVFSKAVLENALKELKPYTKGDQAKSVVLDRDGENISLRVLNPANKLDKTIIIKGKTGKGNYGKFKAGSLVMPMEMSKKFEGLGIKVGAGHLGGFQLGYLQDAVSSVSGNDVYFGRLDDPLKPVVIRGKPFDKFVAVKKAKQRGPGKGAQASTGGGSIESFEQNTGPIYYSQLQRTIEQKMPNAAPVSMVRALIDPAKGNVKAEEVEWSGINEFLEGKEKVSKAELLEFLKSNEVQIKEVVKGDDGSDEEIKKLESKIDQIRSRFQNSGYQIENNAGWTHIIKNDEMQSVDSLPENLRSDVGEFRSAQDDIARLERNSGKETKFKSYQLPGGSNYREVLLTLPTREAPGYTFKDIVGGRTQVFDPKGMNLGVWPSREDAVRAFRNVPETGNFLSSHFDEPNILAHVRMNDRTTADGKRVLFLEEVQSDWHQAGREKGYNDREYRSKEERLHEIGVRERQLAEQIFKESNNQFPRHQIDMVLEQNPEYIALQEEKDSLMRGIKGQDAVPNAPFKKSWHELALKRMLRYAVDNGYDGIAWTTGEQQAERYDLSKDVQSVEYLDGFLRVKTHAERGGTRDFIHKEMPPEKIQDYIGKEPAKKLLESPKTQIGQQSGIPIYRQMIEGEDLKVGGEGMKGFYDQIIPAFLNKYTKKWGGRVGEQLISFVPEEKYDIRNTGSRWQLVVRSTGERVPNSPLFNSGNDAENWILKNRQTTVHYLDITPSMRESVAQGQPLFAKGTAKDSAKIESFEQLTPKEQEQTFKMARKVRDLVKKYAVRVGERYVPRRAAGAYYPKTQNIRLNSLNDLSVAIHEITHSIDDAKARTSEKILNARDRETVKGLTEIYTTYYANGKSNHPVKLRIVEGLATLIQKTAESPTMMHENYGTLLDKFTNSGGRYYDTNYVDLLADAREIVGDFQQLDKLSQVGAFVTSKFQQKEARDSFLSAWDKIRSEMSDAVWPVEKAARKAGLERKAGDPSLWMRAYQGIVGNIENNMVGSKGFWIPTQDGGFKKVSDKNFSDLLGELGKLHLEDRFGWWLIARDSYFEWKRLDKITAEIEGLKEKIQLLPETMTPELMAEKKGLIRLLSEKQVEHDEFLQRLNREPLGRVTFERAYLDNKNDFQAFEKTFDTFPAANLDLIEMANMATPEELDVLRQKEGYAPKKRDIYDDIIGSEKQQLPTVQVGKTKLSSMMARKGSSLSYVNPLYSVIKDHAEIMRKSMKQMVYNKMLSIAPSWPEVFQPVELKVIVDKQTGKTTFPQEKDPNIIMARGVDGKRSPLLVGRDMKNVIDDVLGFHDIHSFERLLRKSARMFSQLTTGAYPPFILTNLAMDIPTAIANTRTKMTPVYSALKELGKAITSSDTPEAKYAAEWLASHGERQSLMGWQTLDPDEYFRLLQKEKNWIERATQSVANGIDFLSIPGKYSEIMSRMTEYILSRKAGNPWIVAMEDSARVTTPFTHMGRWGGGTWMKTLVKSIPFFNPGIQGLDQFVRSASQKDTQKRLLFVLTATVLASVAGMSWIMKHATDEQKDQYKDLEGASLTGHVWFPSSDGKNLIKVRVLEQFGWLAALLNMAIGETIYGVDYKFRDYADAATSWVPNQFDISNPVMALLNWVPQIIKPSLEVIFDKRTFPTVRPLTPRNQQNIKPGLRSTETTSSVAKELGKRLDLSPIAIDHLIEGYLGRTARFGTGRFYSMKMNPFFQDWYFTSGRNLQDFYDTRERWQYLNTEFKTNPKGIPDEEKRAYFYNGQIIKKIEARLEVIREYQKVGKPLKGEKLYRNRHAILEDIAKLK